MTSKKIFFVLSIFLTMGIFFSIYQNREKKGIIHTALLKAAQEKKIVFVKVGETWCPPCVKMDELLATNSKLQELVKQFVFVKTGLENPEVKELNVSAIPFLIFYGADGKEIKRHTGFLQAKDMIVFLENILEQRK